LYSSAKTIYFTMGLEDLVTPGNLEDRFEVGKVVGQVCFAHAKPLF
jgi:hypothetical protein